MRTSKTTWPVDGYNVIDESTLERYDMAGFGRSGGLGEKPALVIIDVQYRSTGTKPMPFKEAIQEFRTSCGEPGWVAVPHIAELLELFRANDWPVLYAYVAPKKSYDQGRLGAKVPALMGVASHGYDFPEEIAPQEGDILLPKRHPSAFFGTPLVSYLVERNVDTLVVTGATTSGCVRSTVVDAFSYNFHVAVPADAVYDRSDVVHEVNLFDMAQKYADVTATTDLIQQLTKKTEA